MAIIRQGILGGLRGRIGNVVGTGWKGRAVLKSLPLTVANPRTAGQVLQRSKFSILVTIGSNLLATIIKPLWDRSASGMSGFNAFISANQNAFQSTGYIDAELMTISRGRMIAPSVTSATVSGKTVTVAISNPSGDRFALPTDNIFIAWFDAASGKVAAAGQTSAVRGAGSTASATITAAPTTDITNIFDVFVSYMRTDGTEVSNSSYASL